MFTHDESKVVELVALDTVEMSRVEGGCNGLIRGIICRIDKWLNPPQKRWGDDPGHEGNAADGDWTGSSPVPGMAATY